MGRTLYSFNSEGAGCPPRGGRGGAAAKGAKAPGDRVRRAGVSSGYVRAVEFLKRECS